MNGQLSTSNDVDWYSFNATGSGLVSVVFDAPTDDSYSTYFTVGLYNSSGGLLRTYGIGRDSTLNLGPISVAGTYYVRVDDGYYSSNGQYAATVNFTAGSVANYESETNDTLATADAVTLGSAMNGQLSTPNDVDWYKLAVAAPGIVTVSLDVPTSSSYEYFGLSFYNSTGVLLGRYSTGSDKTFQFAAPQAGTFYLRLDAPGYYYSGGGYMLTASAGTGATDQELEPNDKDANAIALGREIRGQVSTEDDIDWFVLAADGAGDLQIAFDAPTNSSTSDYFRIWVFDEAANFLASRSTGVDINFYVGMPAAGNFYIAVTTDSSTFYSGGQYGLRATTTRSNINRESEPNNDTTSADSLGLNTAILGQLSGAEDEDYYALTIASPGVLSLNFDGPTNSSYLNFFKVEVYSPTGALLASRNTGTDTSLEVKAATSGRYVTVVSAASAWSVNGEDYRLTASAALEDAIPESAIKGTSAGERLTGTTQGDLIYGLGGDDLIDGGAGTDTVVFRAPATSLSINTIGGLTAVRGGFDAGEHAFTISRIWNVEKVKTSTDEKTITASSISPLLGTIRADRLLGTSGNDVIDGLGGSDFIDGADGTDTLILFGPKEKFDTQSISGITRIEGLDGAQEYAGHVMRIVNVETINLTQSQSRSLSVDTAKRIFGSAGSDRLSGTLADEVFDGLGGSDTFDGGAGNDTLVVFGRYEDFSLTFPTPQNANLVVTGKESAARDYAGQILHTTNIERIIFSGEVVIEINNPPSLMITPASTLLAEGETGKVLALTLSTQPLKPVQVTLETDSQISANIANLSFDPENWSQPQIIIVTAVDDNVLERQHGSGLSIRTVSEDVRYQSLTSTVSYTITDNDTQNLGGVSGKFWNDANIDGIFDSDERALVGWTVFDDLNRNGRLDTGELTATTDSSGLYRLNDLVPGRHTISARSETGWSATFPSLQAGSAAVLKNTAGSGESSLGTYYELPTLAEVSSTGNSSNLGVATNIGAFKSDPRFSDIQGQGLSVVVIDTGIDLDHPFFGPDTNGDRVADRIVYHYDYSGSNDASAGDFNGHGTHVAGIVASSDLTYPGIATAINIIVLKVFPDGNGGAAQGDTREALDWVVANTNRYNIVAVNLSLGGGQFDTSPRQGYLSTQFSALANAGVIVVSASGNDYDDHLDGNPKTTGSDKPGVAYPSSDPYSLSVGAVWAYNGGDWGTIQTNAPIDAIAVFSQRDDTESDIFAPGAAISSAKNGGGAVAMSGTSMAAPEVTGMVALAQQLALRELGRRLSFEEIRDLFKSTGKQIIDGDDENDLVTNTGLTFYRADMLKLAEAIVEMSPKISHTVDVKDGQIEENKNFGFASTSAIQTTSADDFIMGSVSGEVIRGGTGNDEIRGGEGDDEIYGEAGNDSLEGGTGDDLLDGGPGNDTAIFNAPRSSFTVVFDALKNEYSITSTAEGKDRVTNVEAFIFGSQTIAVENLVANVAVTPWGATFWKDNTKAPADTKKADAVNLTDAIAILKMIVGLNVNSNNSALSPYQAIAADFDQSGDVGLTDAIGVLKMVVGLSAPTPTWKYYDDTKLNNAYTAAQSLNPKGWTSAAVILDTGASDSSVKLVGVLTGDVDGSWTGV
jgi:subtilisin family serine protease